MKTDAYLSDDRLYRYWLLRVWNEQLPLVCCIGINPSTADEFKDDPTIRKEIGFGSRNGFGGLLMLNVGAFRATDPKRWRAAVDPIGPENTVVHLRKYLDKFRPSMVIAAWGKNGRYCEGQCKRIVSEVQDLRCFGKNPDGTPRHPLMLPYTTAIVPFSSV